MIASEYSPQGLYSLTSGISFRPAVDGARPRLDASVCGVQTPIVPVPMAGSQFDVPMPLGSDLGGAVLVGVVLCSEDPQPTSRIPRTTSACVLRRKLLPMLASRPHDSALIQGHLLARLIA